MHVFVRAERTAKLLFINKSIGRIRQSEISVGTEMIKKKMESTDLDGLRRGGEAREYPRMIMGRPIVAAPPSACTETYLVVGAYDTEKEAKSLSFFLRTRFLRFLVGLRKNTQHITKDRFAFVPQLDMSLKWTDEMLHQHFGLITDEISFIESMIRPMEASDE